jgi:hypothetical protein
MRVRAARYCAHVGLDEVSYLAFLRKLGITEEQLSLLEVSFHPQFSLRSMYGGVHRYDKFGWYTIELNVPVLLPFEMSVLNFYLLHETRHFIQACRGEDYTSTLWMEHDLRPEEVDAMQFAEEHKEQFFILVDERKKPSLRNWWGIH